MKILKKLRLHLKPTPLLRQANISTTRFKEYFNDLIKKKFIKETNHRENKFISLTEKGFRFLEKYSTIVNFIEEFEYNSIYFLEKFLYACSLYNLSIKFGK